MSLSRPCVLIVLPNGLDLAWWRIQCEEADPRATEQIRGRTAVEGVSMRTLITYPQLLIDPIKGGALRNTQRVYVGWQGKVRFWHQGADVECVLPAHIKSMDPLMAHLMWPGEYYLWVGAVPIAVPEEWPLPAIPRSWPLPYFPGSFSGPEPVVPHWFDPTNDSTGTGATSSFAQVEAPH